MRALRSFRARLLVGSLLWTGGLLAAAHLLFLALLRRHSLVLRLNHWALVAGAAVCLVAGLWIARRSLTPFRQLRDKLSAVRDGLAPRIDGSYPSEVQPLVNDLNALLEHREGVVRRALGKAGDLAHGLKTPLAVLSREAERAGAAGHREQADVIRQQLDRMRRQVDYHLVHARAAASGPAPGARSLVRSSAEGLARALLRLHAERRLAIAVEVASGHWFRGEQQDLDEMLGNLLDNACKWAASRVVVASSERDGKIVVTVDDDGAGLPPSMWDVVLQRGVRYDEAAPGSGLGLAIVRDLAELYGGSVSLGASPLGGLRVRLELPA